MKPDKPLPEPRPLGWERIAIDVLKGRYNKCDLSTAQSIVIGLRCIESEECRKAVKALCELKKIKDQNKL